ncbi:hypothetical protein B5V88_17605, partial [Heyndrickxia sporothermodurans]|uniref:hypothetical protein n=1 Tax=Heyndrickxia sporothermodurans TaxID=46224 RepID=UPI000D46C948
RDYLTGTIYVNRCILFDSYELYAVFNKKVAPEERNDRVKHWMKEIKQRMEENVAIVDIDFLT